MLDCPMMTNMVEDTSFKDDQLAAMTTDDIIRAPRLLDIIRDPRLLDNEIRILKEGLQRTNLELEKIKGNQEKIKLNKLLPYLVGNIVEVAKLQDDNKALDCLTKSKEAALLEAERTVEVALGKASMVDDLQNKNQELMKQFEMKQFEFCQEENKILDRMHRQKVAEVEKLTQTVRELEVAVLDGGAAANTVRDYQWKFQEINEERKTLDRELARAKVTANRVAVVVANEWKERQSYACKAVA